MESTGRGARAYRSERRAVQARDTRRRILRATTAAFLERGYADTTLRSIAVQAGVSLPTVESTFGTKAALLKAAIDVAIAGDDEPVPMVERDWAAAARDAGDPASVLRLAADVIAESQARSAGLVLAAFEGATASPDLRALADQLAGQRAETARWIVDTLASSAPLRAGWTPASATDLLWVLMDPAVYVRLVRDRGWSPRAYRDWWLRAAALLVDAPASIGSLDEPRAQATRAAHEHPAAPIQPRSSPDPRPTPHFTSGSSS